MEKLKTYTQDDDSKPTFIDIFIQLQYGYHIFCTVAERAMVPLPTVYRMLLGKPVSQEQAEKVLQVISRHMKFPLELDMLEIPLRPAEQQ